MFIKPWPENIDDVPPVLRLRFLEQSAQNTNNQIDRGSGWFGRGQRIKHHKIVNGMINPDR